LPLAFTWTLLAVVLVMLTNPYRSEVPVVTAALPSLVSWRLTTTLRPGS
jgi:hypothetical protein